MGFVLDKTEEKDLQKVVSALREQEEALDAAFAEANSKLDDVASDLNEAIKKYNSALEDADHVVSGIANRLREEYDEKSEQWQDDHSEIADMIDQWESVEFEEIVDVGFDEVKPERSVDADDLDTLPTEV